MQNLYKEAADLLRNNQSFVMATIFDKTGSVPRTAGAKMIVLECGTISGTIGGGRLEADAMLLTKDAFYSRQTLIQSFDLASNDIESMDMICGGKGEILLEYIDADDENNLLVYESAARLMEKREKAWVVTILTNIPRTAGVSRRQCLIKNDKTCIGQVDCDPCILDKLISRPAQISIHAEVIDNCRFVVEPLRQAGSLYIFGAGHVSQSIASLSANVDFRTVVIDDRIEYANRERFPEPVEIMAIKSFEQLPDLAIDQNSYLVVVTRGHLFDRMVLQQLLRSGAGYIGMIGSRRKRDQIFEQIMNHGFVKEELERVYSPIGTNIGAETPQELAVSIVGELIMVRAEKQNAGTRRYSSDCIKETCWRAIPQ